MQEAQANEAKAGPGGINPVPDIRISGLCLHSLLLYFCRYVGCRIMCNASEINLLELPNLYNARNKKTASPRYNEQ